MGGMLGRQPGEVHLGQRQHAGPLAPDDPRVELPPQQETLHQGRLAVGGDDGPHLVAQGGLAGHHRLAVQADAGVLLAGLHDHRELPAVAVHVPDALQQAGVGGNGDAGPLQQAGAHELVPAQAQAQRRGAGQGEAHHAHQGGHPHLVQGAVHHVVVLVEDHVGGQAQEAPLEGRQVVGQGHQVHLVAQPAQRAGDAAHQLAQVPHPAVIRAGLRAGFLVGVVDQRDPALRPQVQLRRRRHLSG